MFHQAIAEDLTQKFGAGTFQPMVGRGNSRVGVWEAGKKHFIKMYPPDPLWDRQDVEHRMLVYYASYGIHVIPEVIYINHTLNYTVFRFIEGASTYPADQPVLHQLQQFLERIFALPDDGFITEAKEAFFHTDKLKAHIDERLAMMRRIPDPVLQDHLKTKIDIAFAQAGYDRLTDCTCGTPIVSPSDFGLHNSILSPDGRIYFIDFEYGGRDSKFKLLGDIYWHPGANLSFAQRTALIAPFLTNAAEREIFEKVRVLMGLKWALLLLNEFIPANLAKRLSASGQAMNEMEIKAQQLAKSNLVLENLLAA